MTSQPGRPGPDPDEPEWVGEPDEPDGPDETGGPADQGPTEPCRKDSDSAEGDADQSATTDRASTPMNEKATTEATSTNSADEPLVDEDVWAELVAAYHSADAEPVGRWSAAEDLDGIRDDREVGGSATDAATDSATEDGEQVPDRPEGGDDTPGGTTTLSQGAGGSGQTTTAALSGPDDEHFVPPPPPPIPRTNRRGLLGWLALTAAPVVAILRLATDLYLPNWLVVLAICMSTAGFLVLVSQPRTNSPDDGDGGAVV